MHSVNSSIARHQLILQYTFFLAISYDSKDKKRTGYFLF